MKQDIYRQGDVLLVRTGDQLPQRAEKMAATENRIVLAYGEVTGHAHAIALSQANLFIDGDTRYLKVAEEGADLVHEEHAPIHLKAGVYRVVQQREYIPQSSRTVLD
jgi:hypothetical protein